jgi:hypothetical protein
MAVCAVSKTIAGETMIKGLRAAGLGILLCVIPGPAFADTLFTSASFSGLTSLTSIQPFNTALGTLTSVEVTIDGDLSATIQTDPLLDFTTGAPIPTPLTVDVDQTFQAVGSTLFVFSDPATYIFNGTAIGLGEPETFVSNFIYGFTFNATSDLIGFTFPSFSGPTLPPIDITGTVAGFEDTASPIFEELMITEPPTVLTGNGVPASYSSDGAILVEYDYTPTPPPSVSEPGSAMLLGAGLICGIVFRRRRCGKFSTVNMSSGKL